VEEISNVDQYPWIIIIEGGWSFNTTDVGWGTR